MPRTRNNRDQYNLHDATQLKRGDGLRGQNSPSPLANFGNGESGGHTFVRLVVGGTERWFDPSYGTEYVGQNDAAKINDFEDRALYGIVVDDVEDLEVALRIDLDGDGSITPESDMTQVVQQIAIRRQKPGMRDTQFKFTNSIGP